MSQDTDTRKSYWWSLLSEFGEEVLLKQRIVLGISQTVMAKRCGMAQSEISRIERGLVTPQNIPTSDEICDEYRLKQEDKDKYAKLVAGTKNPNDSNGSKGVLQLLKKQIAFVANLNRSGNPKMAIKQAQIIRSWIKNEVYETAITKNKRVIRQFSLLLLEESAAWWDIAENQDELRIRTAPLLNKGLQLDPKGSFYLTNKAFHYYIFGDSDKVLEVFPKIRDIKTNGGHNWGMELLRIKTITAASKNDVILFKNLEKEIQKQILNPKVDQINKAYLMEGLGKAYSFIDKEKAITVLRESQKLMDTLITNPLFWKIRYVQLARSYLMATKDNSEERTQIKGLVDLALQICNQCGFIRHKKQILSLM